MANEVHPLPVSKLVQQAVADDLERCSETLFVYDQKVRDACLYNMK